MRPSETAGEWCSTMQRRGEGWPVAYTFRLVLRLQSLCFGPVVGWIMPAPVIVNPPDVCDAEGPTLTVLAPSADGDAVEVDCWDCERTKADEGVGASAGRESF